MPTTAKSVFRNPVLLNICPVWAMGMGATFAANIISQIIDCNEIQIKVDCCIENLAGYLPFYYPPFVSVWR